VEARFAITDLVNAYALYARRGTPEEIPALFTPDAFYDVLDGHPDEPDFTVRPRIQGAELKEFYATYLKEFYAKSTGNPHPVPLITNLTIDVDGDSATGTCVMKGPLYGTEDFFWGEYHDTFRRVDGRWLFASRTYLMYPNTVYTPEQHPFAGDLNVSK
jgi:hypothetical protein